MGYSFVGQEHETRALILKQPCLQENDAKTIFFQHSKYYLAKSSYI